MKLFKWGVNSEVKTKKDSSSQHNSLKTTIAEIRETFNRERIYRARWVWYHTILAGELFLIIILLIAILAKI